MNQSERRLRLLEVLCIRRHDTYANLAREFQVSKRTIQYDIEALICCFPIETVSGRYGGGIWVAEGYYLHQKSSGGNELNEKQTLLLRKLRDFVSGDDLDTLNKMLVQFAPRPTVP